MAISSLSLHGQIAGWLNSFPSYNDVDKYVSKFPESNLNIFADAIEAFRADLIEEKRGMYNHLSLGEWGEKTSELIQYECLEDLRFGSSLEKQALVTEYPQLTAATSEQFQAWIPKYLKRWYVLALFMSERDYLEQSRYLLSLRKTNVATDDYIELANECQEIIRYRTESVDSNTFTTRFANEKELLIKLKIFSVQSVEDFMARDGLRYKLFEMFFGILTALAGGKNLDDQEMLEVLRRGLITKALRILLARCERERIRRNEVFDDKILPWLRNAFSFENIDSGQALIILRDYISALNKKQKEDFYPYLRASMKYSSSLENIFAPVPVLEVCKELSFLEGDNQKFEDYSRIVIDSRDAYTLSCKNALLVIFMVVQAFPGFSSLPGYHVRS